MSERHENKKNPGTFVATKSVFPTKRQLSGQSMW